MIELIRDSAVPAHLMRTAARGALSLPASEMLEILVFLSTHPIFGVQAQLTLAGWDHASALAVVSDPQAPVEVLDYFSNPRNCRPDLLAELLENSSTPESRLLELAQNPSRELLSFLLASTRVRSLPQVLRELQHHPAIADIDARAIALQNATDTEPLGGNLLEPEVAQYLQEHAAEIEAGEGKPFQLIDPTMEEQQEVAAASPKGLSALAAHALASSTTAGTRERLSPVQKIARLSVGERVQLALKGNRDERFILIRDGAKVVSSAVLESPKLTDSEVEMFASMKNVAETVMRGITSKRKFMKNYAVKRLLSANPRCPIDVALPLVKELLVTDLKNLSINKNVSDTVRRFAVKMWKEKTTAQH